MLVTWMKSNLSTKALLESKLGSRVEESLPKKKKRKERRRNKRNKKSSEGCQIKRRKAKKMFPWMFMPGIESGRSRRRRESSSDSRRRRRDRRRRDKTRSRERSRGRRHPLPCQWRSQGTVGAKSRRRSFMEEQGLLWPRPRFPLLQRPLFSNGLNNSAEPKWRPPAQPDPKDKPLEGGEVFAAAPTAPDKILTKWRRPQRKRLRRLQLGRLSASTPIYGRRPYSRPWLIPIGLCVLGSWSRMAA